MAASSTHTKATLSPTENLLIGAAGGAVETSFQMPIITYKFCSQEGRAMPSNIAGWYRGVFVQAGTVAPITAVQFCLNGLLQQAFRSLNPGNNNNDNERALSEKEILSASFGAGALSALFYGPVDLVTIQQQKLHSAPIATVRTLMKEYGTLSLFRGLGATIVREGIYTAGYLGLSPVIAHHLMEKKQNTAESESLLHDEYCYPMFGNRPFLACIVGACMAGSLSAILTHPADTAKTCVQSDMMKQKWPNARIALLKMWKGEVEGGTGRMWKGLGPRIMRLSGASYVCISFQEMAMNLKTEWSEVKF